MGHVNDTVICIHTVISSEFSTNHTHYMYAADCVGVCRLKEGLKTLGVLDAMQTYPQQFKSALCDSGRVLCADALETMFAPQLSPPGSSKRTTENHILSRWFDFLQDIEGTECFCRYM